MSELNDISDMSNLLGEGFFADRVVRVLAQHKQVGVTEKNVLERIQQFMKQIRKGQHQVNTGKLSGDAVESIGAYWRAIITLKTLVKSVEELTENKLKELIQRMDKEIEDTLEKGVIDPSKVKNTRSFFENIQRETVKEVGKYYGRRSEVLTWPR